MNLAQLALKTKEVEFDFPLIPNFKVKITHLSKPEEMRLREDSLVTKFDDETNLPYQVSDPTKFLENFASRTITGWSGLTYKALSKLMLIDESQVEDMDAEVEYNAENALALLKYSKHFDTWVTSVVARLDNFRTSK
jgi:hypothetical protein